MTQEVYGTLPAIRAACEASFFAHAGLLVDIEATIEKYGVQSEWTEESLAVFTQAALQGVYDRQVKERSGASHRYGGPPAAQH